MTHIKRYLLLSALMALNCLAVLSQGVSMRIQAQDGSSTPAAGETFYLVIDTHNATARPGAINSFPGSKVLYAEPQAQTEAAVNINGKNDISGRYFVTMRAETPGSYTFGPLSVGGKHSGKLSFKIKAASPGTSQAYPGSTQSQGPVQIGGGNGTLFARATVSNSSPYEQQGVEYVVRLYSTYTEIWNWMAAASPKFGNCTYEMSDAISRQLTMTEYNGRAYESAIIARYILYPTQPGKAVIKGNNYTGTVAQKYTYRDPSFGIMSHVKPLQTEATPNDVVLNVRPLPPHEGDVNGVGDFSVSASLVSKSFKAHEAATVRYVITGTGNLGFLSLPDLKNIYPAEIKFLKSDDTTKKQVGASSVSGSVTYDCTIIPQREGEFDIPAVKFQFFNPTTGQYYTATAPGFKIKVEQGEAKSAMDRQLKFIDTMQPLGDLSAYHMLWISSSVLWLVYIVPLALLVLLAIVYRKRMNMLADIAGMAIRRAGRVARRRLKRARECAKKHDTSGFYKEMLKAIWGYLGDKLQIPTSELSRDNISGKLDEAGVSDSLISRLVELIDECEFAQYGSTASMNLREVYDQGCRIIDDIEAELQKSVKSSASETKSLEEL